MIYFTADTHFGHFNIISHCWRPFDSIEEMNEALLSNINTTVKRNDILFHLGDVALRSPCDFLDQINCKDIRIILGNHDRKNKLQHPKVTLVTEFWNRKINHQNMTLCHYAMRVWNKSHHGAWHLYGHSHQNLEDDPNALSIDVGVDARDYRPISFDEVAAIMKTKSFVPVDHHR